MGWDEVRFDWVQKYMVTAGYTDLENYAAVTPCSAVSAGIDDITH